MNRLVTLFAVCALSAPAQWTREQQEEFLANAEILSVKELSIGITNSSKAELSDGSKTHDAHIQTVEVRKLSHQTARGTELNFRDSYKFNVAAYKVDQLLGLDMVPTSVERKVRGDSAAVTWWVDDFLMMEVDRFKKKTKPPDQVGWNKQMFRARVFNELVYNTDANLQNVLIDKNWRVWLIDFTRAFRVHTKLRAPKNLGKIDRGLLESLEALREDELVAAVGKLLTKGEANAVLARRDVIVETYRKRIAEQGEDAVFFDYP